MPIGKRVGDIQRGLEQFIQRFDGSRALIARLRQQAASSNQAATVKLVELEKVQRENGELREQAEQLLAALRTKSADAQVNHVQYGQAVGILNFAEDLYRELSDLKAQNHEWEALTNEILDANEKEQGGKAVLDKYKESQEKQQHSPKAVGSPPPPSYFAQNETVTPPYFAAPQPQAYPQQQFQQPFPQQPYPQPQPFPGQFGAPYGYGNGQVPNQPVGGYNFGGYAPSCATVLPTVRAVASREELAAQLAALEQQDARKAAEKAQQQRFISEQNIAAARLHEVTINQGRAMQAGLEKQAKDREIALRTLGYRAAYEYLFQCANLYRTIENMAGMPSEDVRIAMQTAIPKFVDFNEVVRVYSQTDEGKALAASLEVQMDASRAELKKLGLNRFNYPPEDFVRDTPELNDAKQKGLLFIPKIGKQALIHSEVFNPYGDPAEMLQTLANIIAVRERQGGTVRVSGRLRELAEDVSK